LKGDTELTANPIAVTAVASPSRALGVDASSMICQRQLRIAIKPSEESIPSRIQPQDAPRIAEPTSEGWTDRSNP